MPKPARSFGKHPGGAPRISLEDLPKNWQENMIECALGGASELEVRVSVLGSLNKQTWHRLIEDEPEFAATVMKCKELCQMWWERQGRDMATGKSEGSSGVWIFNMKNRFQWSDRQETTFHMEQALSDADREARINGIIDAARKRQEQQGDVVH